VRLLWTQLKLDLDQLSVRIDEADAVIQKTAHENEACRRLVAIPGIGPVTATALIATIGNGGAFHKGREFAAWLGIVPREHSTGGQQKLLGISKRGNSYLRRLFVQGARAVLQQRTKQSSGLSAWLAQLTSRTHHNVAAVFKPVMFNPFRRITPAPKKPIPETTCPAMRKLSSGRAASAESMTNMAAPAATRAFVRRPAMRCRHCRSAPMKAPRIRANPKRIAN